jgi:hypothetical protein
MKTVLCSGNEEHFQYFILWLASLVQKPNEKLEVAIVLQGDKGAGKVSNLFIYDFYFLKKKNKYLV